MNSEDDRGRPMPAGALLGSRVFERAAETGDLGEMCEITGCDCEIGMGEAGDVAGVSLGKTNDDDVRDGGVPAGEAVMGLLTLKCGEGFAVDVEGRRER